MVPFSAQGFQFSYMLNNMCCLLMPHPCWDVMVLFYVFWVLSHLQIQCHEDFFFFSMRFRISNLVFESSIHYTWILFTWPFLWRSSSLASFIEEIVYSIQNGLNPLSRVRQLRNNRHVDTCTKTESRVGHSHSNGGHQLYNKHVKTCYLCVYITQGSGYLASLGRKSL